MKARKKPVEVEVFEYDGDFMNSNGEYYVPGWAVYALNTDGWMEFEEGELYINTLEGRMHVSVGDYVIQGVSGEIYPCKPDIFEETYEIVMEE